MAIDTLLVSEEKLKSFTSANFNLSPEDLLPYVFDAQQIYLQNYLGATYLNALKSRVQAGTTTSADETLLNNYIGPMLCNWALYVALPFIKYRLYNKGVLSGTSENADGIELDELQFLMNQVQNIAENYTRRLQQWLIQHVEDYPEWNAPNVEDGQLPQKSQNYYKNFVVPYQGYAYGKRMRNRWGNGDWGGFDCYNLPNSAQ